MKAEYEKDTSNQAVNTLGLIKTRFGKLLNISKQLNIPGLKAYQKSVYKYKFGYNLDEEEKQNNGVDTSDQSVSIKEN